MIRNMDRNQIEEKYKWDLTKIYETDEDFEKDFDKMKKRINEFSQYETKMGIDAKNFYQTLYDYYDISRNLEKLYMYSHLKFDENTSDNMNQALSLRVGNLYDEWNKACFFVSPTILKKNYSEIETYYKEEPKLLEYEIMLKREFRYKEHTLSDEEEKLLANMSKMLGCSYQTYELLKDSDLTFGKIIDEDGSEVELTGSNYSIYIESLSQRVRKDAFNTLYKTYKQFINTFASTLFGTVNENRTIAQIKKFNSTLEWCLFADELDVSIYDNLVYSVSNHLNTLFKYYDLKKEILGLDELHLYDIYTPIVSSFKKKYPFEDAKKTVLEALSVLGEDYTEIFKQGMEDRWIDVYPTNAKRSGAYSSGSYETFPYILLNYQEKYEDMSTLAHEGGHSMHSYYARSNNPYQYGDYAIFVAEVASTVNELLLAKYLLKVSNDREEKLFILDNLMNLFKGTIYRQTMFAEFERDIYRDSEHDIPLTADYLSDKYYKLNEKYFGKNVVIDNEIRYEWARIPHFYYNFYVYKYATGLSAASHIVNDILSGKENAVENYKRFLKCGTTKNPIDSLKLAGVDLNDKEVVESALKMFDEVIEEFKMLYKESK